MLIKARLSTLIPCPFAILIECRWIPQAEKAAEDERAGNGASGVCHPVAEDTPSVPPTSVGGSRVEIDLTTPDGSWVIPF